MDEKLYAKLDTAIERLTEVSNEIKQVLIVHETKLDNQDRSITQYREDIKELHSRIGSLRDEMVLRLNDLEKWRWILMGGAIVFGAIIGNSRIMDLFMG